MATLLICANNPEFKGVGELFLGQISSYYNTIKNSELIRYSIASNVVSPSNWEGFKSFGTNVHSTRIPFVSTLDYLAFRLYGVNQIVYDIVSIINEQKVTKLLFVLSSPKLIILAKKLIEMSNVSFSCIVWDVPEYLKSNQIISDIDFKYILNDFHYCLEHASKVGVVSYGMLQYYSKYISDKYVIVNNCLPDHIIPPITKETVAGEIKNDDCFKIVFAGSLYAKLEWNSLVSCLRMCNFVINGKSVQLTHIGERPKRGLIWDHRIISTGYVSQQRAIDIISNNDIAYLPYWFDPKKSLIVKTSFPGKLTTYMAAGCPILYHGPEYADVNDYVKNNCIGFTCNSNNINDLYKCLVSVSLNLNNSMILKANLKREYLKRFSEKFMYESLSNLLEL